MSQGLDWTEYEPRKGWYCNTPPSFFCTPDKEAEYRRKFGHPTLDGYSALAELWGTPKGRIFWRLCNWGGFYHCEPLIAGRKTVDTLPPNAFLLMKDGEWVDRELRARSTAANEAEFYGADMP